MGFLQRIAAVFNTGAAEQARRGVRASAGYDAAKVNRNNHRLHLGVTSLSGDTLVLRDGSRIRGIGRHLYRNTPAARRTVKNLVQRVIGTQGIIPQFESDEIDAAFKRWAVSAGVRGQSWRKLQGLALADKITAGNSYDFWAVVDRQFKIDSFEPEELSTKASITNSGNIAGGVLYDDFGRPIKYFVSRFQPGSSLTARDIEIDAFRVVHYYDQDRKTAFRGVSDFASGAISLFDAHQTIYAEVKDLLQQAEMGFHAKPSPASFVNGTNAMDLQTIGAVEASSPDADGDYEIELSPGRAFAFDGDIKLLESARPSTQFMGLMGVLYQNWAVSVGVPPHVVTGDYSKANYSSLRAAENSCRPTYEETQQDLIEMWCAPLVRAWLEFSRATGVIPLSTDVDKVMMSIEWQREAFPYIDPHKEIQADFMRLQSGELTWDQFCAERGKDGRDQRKAIIRQRERDTALGVETPGINWQPDRPGVRDEGEEDVRVEKDNTKMRRIA